MEIINPLSLASLNNRLDVLQSTLTNVEDTVNTLYKLLNVVLTNQNTLLMQHSMIITNKSLFPDYLVPEYFDPSTHDKESECI